MLSSDLEAVFRQEIAKTRSGIPLDLKDLSPDRSTGTTGFFKTTGKNLQFPLTAGESRDQGHYLSSPVLFHDRKSQSFHGCLDKKKAPFGLKGASLVAGAGFEPATFGL